MSEILREQKAMTPLWRPHELAQYKQATLCGPVAKHLHQNYKVRHHCHVTGDFLFAACTLQLKPHKNARPPNVTAPRKTSRHILTIIIFCPSSSTTWSVKTVISQLKTLQRNMSSTAAKTKRSLTTT